MVRLIRGARRGVGVIQGIGLLFILILLFSICGLSIKLGFAKVTLRAVSCWDKAYHQNISYLRFMELVNSQSKEVEIVWVGGPEFMKPQDQLGALLRGMVDIVCGSVNYFIGLVPEGAILEVCLPPGAITWENERRCFYGGLIQRLDAVFQRKAGAKLLGYDADYLPFYIWTASKKIMKAADLRGLTIRTHGGATDVFVKALGGAPVRITAGEVYLALKTGTVDGALRSAEALKSLNEWEVLKYGLDFPVTIRGGAVHLMNLKKWESLPEHLKQLLIRSHEATEEWMLRDVTPKIASEALEFVKAKGVVLTRLPQEEERELKRKVQDEIAKWYIEKVGEQQGRELLNLILQCSK